MFQVLNKVTGGKPRATRRSSGGRRVILKALIVHVYEVWKKMQELDFIGEVARNKRRLMLNFDYDEKLRIDLKT